MRFNIQPELVWLSYYDARKHKRFTKSQLNFELDLHRNMNKLIQDLQDGTYTIGKSICFIVTKPKPREVFAADFRDRIVHHLIIRYLMPHFEEYFIENSFSCMKGKGTLYGAYKCRSALMRHPNGYVGKFDIKGFFMHIQKELLWKKLKVFIEERITDPEVLDWMLYYTEMVVMHHPELNCERHSPESMWDLIEEGKSLFSIDPALGIAIGNLTSQLFASFYLTELDKEMYEIFGEDYGRYVDDGYMVSDSLETIKLGFKKAEEILLKYGLELHPDKRYIQPVYHGIKFIGYFMKGDRIYIGNGTRSNFIKKIHYYNTHKDKIDILYWNFIQSINSYLGFLKHCNAHNIKIELLDMIDENWQCIYDIERNYESITLKLELKLVA